MYYSSLFCGSSSSCFCSYFYFHFFMFMFLFLFLHVHVSISISISSCPCFCFHFFMFMFLFLFPFLHVSISISISPCFYFYFFMFMFLFLFPFLHVHIPIPIPFRSFFCFYFHFFMFMFLLLFLLLQPVETCSDDFLHSKDLQCLKCAALLHRNGPLRYVRTYIRGDAFYWNFMWSYAYHRASFLLGSFYSTLSYGILISVLFCSVLLFFLFLLYPVLWFSLSFDRWYLYSVLHFLFSMWSRNPIWISLVKLNFI